MTDDGIVHVDDVMPELQFGLLGGPGGEDEPGLGKDVESLPESR